jgi:hypothetical protein
MTGEMRALGLAHGLLLGLLLGSPLIAPGLSPILLGALFLLGGFYLRLADRRFSPRGALSWISHIRMAPLRLTRWAALAIVALIAGDTGRVAAILSAALIGELLIYPLSAHALGKLPRPAIGALLFAVIPGLAHFGTGMVAYVLAFAAGILACLFWLRGPDGEPRALGLSIAGLGAALLMPLLLPATQPYAWPAALVCATLALAHLSTLRRRPMPWRMDGDARLGIRRPPWLRRPGLS